MNDIEISLENGHPLHAHTGRLDTELRYILDDRFGGLTIDDKTLHLYVAEDVDGDKVVETVMKVLYFEPPTEVERVEPSKYELYRQLTRIEQEVQALREAIYKLLPH